jgi:hypothetical protein
MHAHLRKSKAEDLMREHIACFLNTTINVELLTGSVFTGSVFKPMRVQTTYFEPQTCKLLFQRILKPADGHQASQLEEYACVPIGILGLSVPEMRNKCKTFIEGIVSNSK